MNITSKLLLCLFVILFLGNNKSGAMGKLELKEEVKTCLKTIGLTTIKNIKSITNSNYLLIQYQGEGEMNYLILTKDVLYIKKFSEWYEFRVNAKALGHKSIRIVNHDSTITFSTPYNSYVILKKDNSFREYPFLTDK